MMQIYPTPVAEMDKQDRDSYDYNEFICKYEQPDLEKL